MTVTVWTLTSDTNNGLVTRVHATEQQAFENFVQEFTSGDIDRPITKLLDEAKSTNNFEALNRYLQDKLDDESYDSFKVVPHQVDLPGVYPSRKEPERRTSGPAKGRI